MPEPPLHYLAAAEYAEEILNDVEETIGILLEDVRELETALRRRGEADEEAIRKLAEARDMLVTAKHEAVDIRAGLREVRHGSRLDAYSTGYEGFLARRTSELLSRALALINLPEKALNLIRELGERLGIEGADDNALII